MLNLNFTGVDTTASRTVKRVILLITIQLVMSGVGSIGQTDRPNILWIYVEDLSPWIGSYGNHVNAGATPNIAQLAERGVLYERAYAPNPVCSPTRSGVITGVHPIKIDAQHHVSRTPLPDHLDLLPARLKEDGYHTFNRGKTHYNFDWNEQRVYDQNTGWNAVRLYQNREDGELFFGQIHLKGGKNNPGRLDSSRRVQPDEVPVPPEYPQNQTYRRIVAEHYNSIRLNDKRVGIIRNRLKEDGVFQNTVIFYFSDHGANELPRHKQHPTEGGLHVPLIIAGPEKWVPHGKTYSGLVSLLDVTATTAALAGQEIPDYYDGRNLLDDDHKRRDYVFASKDRMGRAKDRVRSVRGRRFRYTKYFKRDRILLQPAYRDPRPATRNLYSLYINDQLRPNLVDIYFGERPEHGFWDLTSDPHQVRDLSGNPGFKHGLQAHREALSNWMDRMNDQGRHAEPEEALRRWGNKIRQGVNPEYEQVREDSDGDGLSDRLERFTGRDPDQGRLHWEFDNGGWQTLGWTGDGLTHLPGRLGFLEFDLKRKPARMIQNDLSAPASANGEPFRIRLRTSQEVSLRLEVTIDGQQHQTEWKTVPATRTYPQLTFDVPDEHWWEGTIEQVEVVFNGPVGTTIEIDAIRISDGDFDDDGVPDAGERVNHFNVVEKPQKMKHIKRLPDALDPSDP